VSVLYSGYEGPACESTLRRKNLCGGSVAHWRAAAAEEQEEEMPAETDSGGRPDVRTSGHPAVRARDFGSEGRGSNPSRHAQVTDPLPVRAAGPTAVQEPREPRAYVSG